LAFKEGLKRMNLAEKNLVIDDVESFLDFTKVSVVLKNKMVYIGYYEL